MNFDRFPHNTTQWNDTDGDGWGDNYLNLSWAKGREIGVYVEKAYQPDAFPDDPAASIDSDGDRAPDWWITGKNGADSTTGLVLDKYPDDPSRYKYIPPVKVKVESDWEGPAIVISLCILILAVISTLIINIFKNKWAMEDFGKRAKPVKQDRTIPQDSHKWIGSSLKHLVTDSPKNKTSHGADHRLIDVADRVGDGDEEFDDEEYLDEDWLEEARDGDFDRYDDHDDDAHFKDDRLHGRKDLKIGRYRDDDDDDFYVDNWSKGYRDMSRGRKDDDDDDAYYEDDDNAYYEDDDGAYYEDGDDDYYEDDDDDYYEDDDDDYYDENDDDRLHADRDRNRGRYRDYDDDDDYVDNWGKGYRDMSGGWKKDDYYEDDDDYYEDDDDYYEDDDDYYEDDDDYYEDDDDYYEDDDDDYYDDDDYLEDEWI
ncbi:MAG: hypothetical protein QF682_11120 [Candidatus Thermoplasmatota archaeon]|nr:hypothetical protein [Candidatus Thermoplasmatota archaeon]